MDNEFPDTIQTTTTTTTGYHTTSNTEGGGRIAIDQTYLRSLPSFLRIAQIVCSFLYWVILAAVKVHYKLGFIIFVGIMAMITAIFYFVIFLLQITKKIPFIAWELSELIANFVSACLFFIAAIITSVRAGDYHRTTEHGKLVFCTLLAWVLTLLFALSSFFSFRAFLAARDRSSSERAATTTTTTTTTKTTAVPEYQGGGNVTERSEWKGEGDVGSGGGGFSAGTGEGGFSAGTGEGFAY